MNLRQQLTAICFVSILFANVGLAQVKRLTLRSDFPAKTVIVSNKNQQVAEKSPFLVAAAVNEDGGQKEFRSLLQFNYDYLPKLILTDPILIESAELVLYPANADFFENKKDEPGKLVVRRIVENWYDSSIAWDNQPKVDSSTFAKEKIRIKGKNQEIRINVTYLVMDMIRYGNKGFMICPNNAAITNALSGLSFASSLNDDKLLRPLLVISYNDGSNYSPQIQQRRDRPVSAPVYTAPTRVPVTVVSNRSE